MEGLQGFIAGGLIFSVLWLTALIFMVGKAYRDGHTDGQQFALTTWRKGQRSGGGRRPTKE